MITIFKQKTKLLLLALLTMLFSCAENEQIIQHSNSKKNELTFKQFINITKIKNFNSIKSIKFNSESLRTNGLESDFIVDTTLVKSCIQNPSKPTYTFKVYPKSEVTKNNEFYNLVYEKVDNQWNEFIVKNTTSPNSTPKNPVIENSNMIYNKFGIIDYAIVSTWVKDCHGCVGACDSCVHCFSLVTTYTPIHPNSTPISNNPTNTGGGGSYYSPNYENEFNYTAVYNFFNYLNNEERTFLDNNNETKTQLINYLLDENITNTVKNNCKNAIDNIMILNNSITNQNIDKPQLLFDALDYLLQNPTNQARDFVLQFAQQSNLNPTEEFDFNKSLKSPGNVNLKEVTPTDDVNEPMHNEKVKFMEVYNKLIESPNFKNLYQTVFNENHRPNVRFRIENLGLIANGAPSGKTEMYNGNRMTVMKINQDLFATNTNQLQIAAAILHEFFHTVLNLKILQNSSGPVFTTAQLNGKKFSDILNITHNTSPDQHDFLYNHMIPVMSQIFTDLKDVLIPANSQTILETKSILYPVTANVLNSPWNWNTFFLNYSLQSLADSITFKQEIGILLPNGTIPNPINIVKAENFIQYYKHAIDNLHN